MGLVDDLDAAVATGALISFPAAGVREDFTKRFDERIVNLPKEAFSYRPARFVTMSIGGAAGGHRYKLNLINWCSGLITYTEVYDNVPVISYPFSGCYMIMFDVGSMHEAGGGVRLHKGRYVAHVHTGGAFDKKATWDNFVRTKENVTPICGFRPDMPFTDEYLVKNSRAFKRDFLCGLLVNPYTSPRLYSFFLQQEEGGQDNYRVLRNVRMRALTPLELRNIEIVPLDVGAGFWRRGVSI